jgi:hypothetical protein
MQTTAAVGEVFARALAAKDHDGLRNLLADPVDFEALTPRRHWRATAPRTVVDDIVFGAWFGPGDTITQLRSVTCGQVADRERVTYRLGVRRGGIDHVVEQQAYFNVDGQRIDWIRILCSGYRPESGPALPVHPDGEPGR